MTLTKLIERLDKFGKTTRVKVNKAEDKKKLHTRAGKDY